MSEQIITLPDGRTGFVADVPDAERHCCSCEREFRPDQLLDVSAEVSRACVTVNLRLCAECREKMRSGELFTVRLPLNLKAAGAE